MDGSFVRLLMVFFVCCTVSVFFITSCTYKEKALLTPEERSLIQIQDAFESCLRQTDDEICLPYMESLKRTNSVLNKPQPVAARTAP